MNGLSGMRKLSCAMPYRWEDGMGSAHFLSGWDTTILIVPFLGMLLMHMFRLDEKVSAPKAPPRNRRSFCEVDPKGRPYVSDPDGQPWRREVSGEIEAK
jgi:hypothetical protein